MGLRRHIPKGCRPGAGPVPWNRGPNRYRLAEPETDDVPVPKAVRVYALPAY